MSLRGVAVMTETAITAETVKTATVASLCCIYRARNRGVGCSPELLNRQNRMKATLVKLFFSYSPPPGIHPPPRPTPLPGSRFRVVFRSFSSRFRVVFESRLEIDSKTTEKRLEIDSLGGGSVVVGDESRGAGCS